MTILNAGQRIGVYVPIGGTLVFAASAGMGSVVRLANPAGGEPYPPVSFVGSATTLGPFDDVAMFNVICTAGLMNFDVAALSAPQARTYSKTVFSNRSSTVIVPANSQLIVSANAVGSGSLVMQPLVNGGQPGSPIPYDGTQLTIDPVAYPRVYAVNCISGPMNITTGYYAGAPAVPSLAALTLSAQQVLESATAGTVVGAVNGATVGSTVTMVDTAGNRFAYSGGNVVTGVTGLDFESGTSYNITLREVLSGSPNSPRDTIITITVTNVLEVTLGALGLSSPSLTQGQVSTINITGASAGSTITVATGSVPAGMTLNSAARTITGTPSTISTNNFTLRETHADATNSPRDTALSVGVVDGSAPLATTSPQSNVANNSSTFTFAATAQVGAYAEDVGGIDDKFVIGPVSVNDVTPHSINATGVFDDGTTPYTRWIHGLMQNPGSGGTTGGNVTTDLQAFDSMDTDQAPTTSTLLDYNHALNKHPFITSTALTSGTLVHAVSDLTPPIGGRGSVNELNNLHIVSSAPFKNSFPPHASDAVKTSYFTTDDLDMSIFPSLALPGSTDQPTFAEVQARIKVMETHFTAMLFIRAIAPTTQQDDYGGDIATALGQAMLFCCLSTPTATEKKRVATMLTRVGLDIWRRTVNGGRWYTTINPSFGGAHQWIKPILVFAARILHNAANTTALASLVQFADGAQKTYFPSDMMITTIDRTYIDTTPSNDGASAAKQPLSAQYQNWMQGAIDWNSVPQNPASVGYGWYDRYRGIVGNPSLVMTLALRMIGADSLWNYAPFFTYTDRYFNWWQQIQGTSYFTTVDSANFLMNMVSTYYATYSARHADNAVPTVTGTFARDGAMWIVYNKLLDVRNVPAASAFAATVGGSPVTLPSATMSLTTNVTATTASQGTVASTAGLVVGMMIAHANLPADTRITEITSGTVIKFSNPAQAAGAASATFTPITIYADRIAVMLPTPMTTGQAGTIAYTAPGSNFARTLGGGAVASFAATAVTNTTGALPAAPTAIDVVDTGNITQTLRQYSGSTAPASATIKRFVMSGRFWLRSKNTGDTILANGNASSSAFKLYMASTSEIRVFFAGQTLQMAGAATALPLNKLITVHMICDFTATTLATIYRVVFKWNGGSHVVTPTSSNSALDGSFAPNIATLFGNGGLFIGGINSTGGLSCFDGGFSEFIFGWGGAGFTLPADYSNAVFDYNASWGNNGENPWGAVMQRYYAGTLAEWNGSQPNRGYEPGGKAMVPKRVDPDTGELVTTYAIASGI